MRVVVPLAKSVNAGRSLSDVDPHMFVIVEVRLGRIIMEYRTEQEAER